MTDAEFVAAMMSRLADHCPGDFSADDVQAARSRDPRLDAMLRRIELRTNDKELTP